MKRSGLEQNGPCQDALFFVKKQMQLVLVLNKYINRILFCAAKENVQEYPFPGKVGGKTHRVPGCPREDLFIFSLLQ